MSLLEKALLSTEMNSSRLLNNLERKNESEVLYKIPTFQHSHFSNQQHLKNSYFRGDGKFYCFCP